MKTIAIISQKGGSGKTTLSINIAVTASKALKNCAIIDLDPQASASKWQEIRGGDDPTIVSGHAPMLGKLLTNAKEAEADLIILDTPPHSESTAVTAAKHADLILIPCRTSILDIQAITDSLNIANLTKTPAFVLLNATPARGTLIEEASELLSELGANICPISITQRADFNHALTSSKGVLEYAPSSKATEEMLSLYRWMNKIIKL